MFIVYGPGCTHAYGKDVYTDVFRDMDAHTRMDRCMHMCIGMCTGMCIDMCTGMCIDMRIDMCIDVYEVYELFPVIQGALSYQSNDLNVATYSTTHFSH